MIDVGFIAIEIDFEQRSPLKGGFLGKLKFGHSQTKITKHQNFPSNLPFRDSLKKVLCQKINFYSNEAHI